MPCKVVSCWTFSTLVGAFLDLAIAYLLLCGSVLAYSASKFLGLFGLCLPCPCNGLFGNPIAINCLQRHLVGVPAEKISSVQLFVKTRFPFDSIWNYDDPDSQFNSVPVKRRNLGEKGNGNFEDEASCSSWSEMGAGNRVINSPGVDKGRLQWKGGLSQKSRYGLRRRKRAAGHLGKLSSHSSSHSSYDCLQSTAQIVQQSPDIVSKSENGIAEGSSFPFNFEDGEEASKGIDLLQQVSNGLESDEPMAEDKSTEKDSSLVEFMTPSQSDLGFDGNEESMIRFLKKALQKEHSACKALYLELEKERSSAATAADEAMAMILRLQEEKASVEMEARQYYRMIEEKAAYDAEEMNILKEILLRREKEKHFLEQEVECYRQMLFGKEQLDVDMHNMTATGGQIVSSLYSSEVPALTSHQPNESDVEKEKAKNSNVFSDDDVTSNFGLQNRTLDFGKEFPIPKLRDDAGSSDMTVEKNHVYVLRSVEEIHQEVPEKGMAYMDQNPLEQLLEEPSHSNQSTTPHAGSSDMTVEKNHVYVLRSVEDINQEVPEKRMAYMDQNPLEHHLEEPSHSNQSTSPQGLNELQEITVPVIEKEHKDNTGPCRGLTPRTTCSFDETKIIFPHGEETRDKYGKDSNNSVFDIDYHVNDIHVVADKFNVDSAESGNNSRQPSIRHALSMPKLCDSPTLGGLRTESERRRVSLERSGRLPPIGPSRGKGYLHDLRRNSMSAFDSERLKIDSEVEWLRERLKIVQEGREKLKFSVGHKEREKTEMQILGNIASQLQEIRQLTEPGKALQQASLPPPFSKVMSKKRRPRTFSLQVQKSI
ncbi:hypothetical protein SLE2022_255960 [Rubroshorea leprosula]